MSPLRIAIVTAMLALGGCATASSGMGGGDLVGKNRPEEPVLFSWQSNDGGISGHMAATLPDATYQGHFLQITHETESSSLAPMWDGWAEGWGDWPYPSVPLAGSYDFEHFTRYYSGKVVANLRNDGGRTMRCRFELNEPARGMSAGAQGECQLASGRTIHALINRS